MIQGMGMTRQEDTLFKRKIGLALQLLDHINTIADPIRTKSIMEIK